MKKLNLKMYQGKDRIYSAVPGASGILRDSGLVILAIASRSVVEFSSSELISGQATVCISARNQEYSLSFYAAATNDLKRVTSSKPRNSGTTIGVVTMTKSKSYQDDLMESLKEPGEAVEYLNAALHDGDPEVFLLALRDVAEALGGVSALSKRTKLNRENLYRMLSKRGNPQLQSLSLLLEALGFKLSVEVKRGGRGRRRAS